MSKGVSRRTKFKRGEERRSRGGGRNIVLGRGGSQKAKIPCRDPAKRLDLVAKGKQNIGVTSESRIQGTEAATEGEKGITR